MKKIRLMVVDDSAVMRRLVKQLFADDNLIEVVATASDGEVALRRIEECRPDVITLDVNMPRMDGLTALRHIKQRFGIPVLMLASNSKESARLALESLELGAFDFLAKPDSSDGLGQLRRELRLKVRAALRASLPQQDQPLVPHLGNVRSPRRVGVVAIGASSGGPSALRYLLSSLPCSFSVPILCVQHMPAGFIEAFALWLAAACSLEVKLAADGDLLRPGCVYLAPAERHLSVRSGAAFGRVKLLEGEAVCGHKPSVDVLFRSVADLYGPAAACLVLTGMGSDGADSAGEVRRRGGLVVCQDRATAAVFGMPRACIERGYCDLVLSLKDMPSYLMHLVEGTVPRSCGRILRGRCNG
jgi:two-component system chemotaxis response regulator CheB